jgi:DNA polymerase (family 10)
MVITNQDYQDLLHQIADLLDLSGANNFRIRAYRQAAHTISTLTDSANSLILAGRLEELPGIGPSITKCLIEYLQTGTCDQLVKLQEKFPSTLLDLQKITGLGPKRIKALFQVGIDSLVALENACLAGSVAKLPRFGEKLQNSLLQEIAILGETCKRRSREEMLPLAEAFLKHINQISGVQSANVAGSIRRCKPIVKDIDIIVVTQEPIVVGKAIASYDQIEKILAHGNTKISARIKPGVQVDVRLIEQTSFACTLAYFTGSKDFNVVLRQLALDKGYSLNEYILRPLDGSTPPNISTEQELHSLLGLSYIEPQNRETAAEIWRQTKK